MSSLTTWFGWKINDNNELPELPESFPLNIQQNSFITTDIVNIYAKILTDVVERVHGLSDDQSALLWDSCVKSSTPDGLITMLAKAMAEKRDLFLVYDQTVKVIREATAREQTAIKADYEKEATSKVGVYISFKNYNRSDMLKLYSGLEYSTVGALNKSMNLSKATQFKMHEMRASVSLGDSSGAKAQAAEVARFLANGRDVILDAKDEIATLKPDLTATKESIAFIDAQRSFYLGMPASYITGVLTGGIGSTGENDTKATERGLKNYYFSVMKPVLDAIFGVKVSYKSQDFRQIGQALEALKTFELISEENLSAEMKKKIIESLLDIAENENKTTEAKDVTPAKPAIAPPAKAEA